MSKGLSNDSRRHLLNQLLAKRAHQFSTLQEMSSSDVMPASGTQSWLWTFQALYPQSTAYNMSYAFELAHGLRAKQWERICKIWCARHPLLRSSFFEQNGRVFRRLNSDAQIEIFSISWSDQSTKLV